MDRSDPRLNLPNLLSAYRLGVSPVIFWAIATGRRSLFFTLVCVSLHLYSSKVSGCLLGFFIFFYFLFGYSAWYFYFAFGFSVLAFLEGLVITLISQEPRSNVRGLYWVLQERRPGA